MVLEPVIRKVLLNWSGHFSVIGRIVMIIRMKLYLYVWEAHCGKINLHMKYNSSSVICIDLCIILFNLLMGSISYAVAHRVI